MAVTARHGSGAAAASPAADASGVRAGFRRARGRAGVGNAVLAVALGVAAIAVALATGARQESPTPQAVPAVDAPTIVGAPVPAVAPTIVPDPSSTMTPDALPGISLPELPANTASPAPVLPTAPATAAAAPSAATTAPATAQAGASPAPPPAQTGAPSSPAEAAGPPSAGRTPAPPPASAAPTPTTTAPGASPPSTAPPPPTPATSPSYVLSGALVQAWDAATGIRTDTFSVSADPVGDLRPPATLTLSIVYPAGAAGSMAVSAEGWTCQAERPGDVQCRHLGVLDGGALPPVRVLWSGPEQSLDGITATAAVAGAATPVTFGTPPAGG
ncbi:hypothetical protein [Sinomonas atrocyanea]|uniref:hypothetical protein n=1 Tax=Sinomonas atrocyanea TaxID=37927 RepID=UPI003D98D017